jgi:hypothetical protein
MPSSSAHQQRSSPVLPMAHQEATTPPEVHQQEEEEEATTPPEVHQQEEDQASTATSASTSSSSSEEEEATTAAPPPRSVYMIVRRQQQQETPIMNRVIILRQRLLPPPQQEQQEAMSPPRPPGQLTTSQFQNMILQQRRLISRDQEARAASIQTDARRLLQRQLMEIKKEPLEGFRIKLDGENILKWTAIMFGPPGTPYQGGYFKAVGFSSLKPNLYFQLQSFPQFADFGLQPLSILAADNPLHAYNLPSKHPSGKRNY